MATTYLRRLDPVSLAKVMAMGYALIGLIAGAIIALLSFAGVGLGAAMAEHGGAESSLIAAALGVGAIIILPLFYAVMGFIGGLIAGLVFNVALRWAGGLQLDLG